MRQGDKAIALLFLFASMGCSHIRPDPVLPPSIEAQYPSLEIQACGQLPDELGMVLCPVVKGEPLSRLNFRVMGYYKGTIKVASKECEIDESISYEGTGLVQIPLRGTAEKSCVASVTVSPQFPREEKSGIKIHSLRGHLVVRVLPAGQQWVGFARKVTGDFSSGLRMWVGPQESVLVLVAGCGQSVYNEVHQVVDGFLDLNLSSLVPKVMPIQVCVLEGAVVSQDYQDLLFSVAVANYDPRYTSLPIPSTRVEKGKLYVNADNAVSAIALNEEYRLNNKGSFKFDPQVTNYLRLLTVAGRALLGVWLPEQQVWQWKK